MAIAMTAEAIEKHEWESATRHMQRALSIDDSIIHSSFAEYVVVSLSCCLHLSALFIFLGFP